MIRALSYRLAGSLMAFGAIVGASIHHTPLGLALGFTGALLGLEIALWPVAQHLDNALSEAVALSSREAMDTAHRLASDGLKLDSWLDDKIAPGRIKLIGASELTKWLHGGDETSIDGGLIKTDTIHCPSLRIDPETNRIEFIETKVTALEERDTAIQTLLTHILWEFAQLKDREDTNATEVGYLGQCVTALETVVFGTGGSYA